MVKKNRKTENRIIRKVFWFPEALVEMIAVESKGYKNESAFMKHIISNWFKK